MWNGIFQFGLNRPFVPTAIERNLYASFVLIFIIIVLITIQTSFEGEYYLCLGIEPRAAGWSAQTYPLSFVCYCRRHIVFWAPIKKIAKEGFKFAKYPQNKLPKTYHIWPKWQNSQKLVALGPPIGNVEIKFALLF